MHFSLPPTGLEWLLLEQEVCEEHPVKTALESSPPFCWFFMPVLLLTFLAAHLVPAAPPHLLIIRLAFQLWDPPVHLCLPSHSSAGCSESPYSRWYINTFFFLLVLVSDYWQHHDLFDPWSDWNVSCAPWLFSVAFPGSLCWNLPCVLSPPAVSQVLPYHFIWTRTLFLFPHDGRSWSAEVTNSSSGAKLFK